MINLSREAYLVKPGERVAQLVIGAYAAPEWQWAETLDDSERSGGGFGSTGS
jgi:dUTP pyrophosphatase